MRVGWLEIELRSEMCPATGEGGGGLIDIEIAHEYGLPVIPAKRIKGCLLAVAKELSDCGLVKPEQVEELFGVPGTDRSSALHVHDAYISHFRNESNVMEELANHDKLIQDMKHLQGMEHETDITPGDLLNEFTLLRSRTAIADETGTALPTSLRTMRVIKKGLIFRSEVTISSSSDEADLEDFLKKCTKGLRHIGLGISRGLGEVRCQLTPMQSVRDTEPATEYRIPSDGEEAELHYELYLNNPVIFPGQNGLYHTCEDWIPGNAILGALASMYVKDYSLENDAHQNPDFARIFLRNGVKFSYAYPKVKEKIFYPCPSAWARIKNKETYYDLASGEPGEDEELRGEGQLVCREKDTVWVYEPEKQVRMHHARPTDRGIGHALREDTAPGVQRSADLGQFFQYVSLKAGQVFSGTLRGKPDDLNRLVTCLRKRDNRLRLGRSRTAEYGNATLKVSEEVVPISTHRENQNPKTSRCVIWLVSPMVLWDEEAVRVTTNPEALIRDLTKQFECDVKLEQSFLRFTQIAGYNSKWRLPRQQLPALAAGTALLIKMENAVDPHEIESFLWGRNTGEGCGQVKVLLCEEETQLSDSCCKIAKKMTRKSWPPKYTEEPETLHPFLTALCSKKPDDEPIDEEIINTLNGLNQLPNSTKIHEIRGLFALDPHYKALVDHVANIKNDNKRKIAHEFVEPCAGKDAAYIEKYLQYAKYMVRRRDDDAKGSER